MNDTNSNLAIEPSRVGPLAVNDSQQSIMSVIARAASDPNVDVGKMERLYAMLVQENARKAEQLFNESMRSAQSEMPVIVKDGKNPQTNSRYVLLETMKRKVTPIVTKHGFSMQFSQGKNTVDDPIPPGKIRVLCNISHIGDPQTGGHSRQYHLDLSPDDTGAKGNASKTKIHGEGSTFSYGERYLTKLIFNINVVGFDDDGNQGNKPKPEGASSLGGAVDDRALKRKLVDLTREVSGIVGYALTDSDKDNISQHLIDESFITPEETLGTLAGKRLAEVVAKLEARSH